MDPMGYLVRSMQAEIEADDDDVDDFYRMMGKSEGEIMSYRATRMLIRDIESRESDP